MKRWLFLVFVLLMCCAAAADTEYWSVNTIQHPLNGKIKLTIIPELRFRNGISEFYYLQVYVGPTVSLSKKFDLNLFYAVKDSKGTSGWAAASLGYMDLIYKENFPWFDFNNRNRFEYDASTTVLKYRLLLQFKKAGWFFSDEPFYNCSRGFVDENRAMFGYDKGEWSLGYMFRTQKSNPLDSWKLAGVVNLGLKFLW